MNFKMKMNSNYSHSKALSHSSIGEGSFLHFNQHFILCPGLLQSIVSVTNTSLSFKVINMEISPWIFCFLGLKKKLTKWKLAQRFSAFCLKHIDITSKLSTVDNARKIHDY